MRGRGLWWASALVVAANLAVLGLSAANRSGEPDAILDLTERELRLPVKEPENTALALSIEFQRRRPGPETESEQPQVKEAGWFDRAKLEAIGFDCSRPVALEYASFYRGQPARTTFAALEYEGDEWRRQVEQAPGPDAAFDTRLIAVDVDNDPAALRRRHPDRRRVAIVEATAILRYVAGAGGPPVLMGRIVGVLPGSITVPREWRAALEAYQSDRLPDSSPPPMREPRYRVTVEWGSRFEPRVTSVEPLVPAAPR
ncbi:MAG TPA: DUF4824 family protein [Vicinamibacterales bacterium]|nr:DUF4824 family protein [Vicinamibacterales bacterium]HOQ61270.1 DUF4824 family protein [Vicinamibacterales bacterium]HPK70435.1 DUF4824 family protein [Vicinamibacterales bacterium]